MKVDLNKKKLLAKALHYALTKVKLSMVVNGFQIIPATLCLGDLGEDWVAVFSTERLVMGDSVRINFPQSNGFTLFGNVVGVKIMEQRVIKLSNAETIRLYIKLDHQGNKDFNVIKILEFKSKF